MDSLVYECTGTGSECTPHAIDDLTHNDSKTNFIENNKCPNHFNYNSTDNQCVFECNADTTIKYLNSGEQYIYINGDGSFINNDGTQDNTAINKLKNVGLEFNTDDGTISKANGWKHNESILSGDQIYSMESEPCSPSITQYQDCNQDLSGLSCFSEGINIFNNAIDYTIETCTDSDGNNCERTNTGECPEICTTSRIHPYSSCDKSCNEPGTYCSFTDKYKYNQDLPHDFLQCDNGPTEIITTIDVNKLNKCYNKTNDDGTLINIDTVCNELNEQNCNANINCIYIKETNDICAPNYYYNYSSNKCEPITCSEQLITDGYNNIDIISLEVHNFSVSADCDNENGYYINATVRACTVNDEPYILEGCQGQICNFTDSPEENIYMSNFNICDNQDKNICSDDLPCADNSECQNLMNFESPNIADSIFVNDTFNCKSGYHNLNRDKDERPIIVKTNNCAIHHLHV